MDEATLVTVARVVRTQGHRGEVLCDLLTDFPHRFKDDPHVTLRSPAGKTRETTVEKHWMPTGRSAGRIVLKFADTPTMNDAGLLRGHEVQIAQHQRLTLDENTYYVNDLVSCTLFDGEREIGVVEALHFPQDPSGARLADAAPLFVIQKDNGDELLVPFANAFVQSIDVAAKRIRMSLPDGLLEMNG